jgi:hypothetical protein
VELSSSLAARDSRVIKRCGGALALDATPRDRPSARRRADAGTHGVARSVMAEFGSVGPHVHSSSSLATCQ